MAKDTGWIKLHRNSFNNPLYFSEPFTKWQAWTDLLLVANHKEGVYFVRGIAVNVPRGSVGWGIDELSKRWKWSRGKTERFMQFLESNSVRQIVRQKTRITTLISILNYETYQTDDKTDNKTNSNSNGHQTVRQTDINKNVKNDKNEKEEEIEKKEGGMLPPVTPASVSGYNHLPDGRSYIDREVFFTAEDFNGLPDDKNEAIRTTLLIVKEINKTPEEMTTLWEVFKTMNLTFQKPYRNKDDVYNHFLNWCKTQTFKAQRKVANSTTPAKAEKLANMTEYERNLHIQREAAKNRTAE